MAYGLPVITAEQRTAQNPEIVAMVEGETGLTYPDENAKALARAIRRLIDDQDLRDRMGDAAFKRVRDAFSLKQMVDGMEASICFAAARARSVAGS